MRFLPEELTDSASGTFFATSKYFWRNTSKENWDEHRIPLPNPDVAAFAALSLAPIIGVAFGEALHRLMRAYPNMDWQYAYARAGIPNSGWDNAGRAGEGTFSLFAKRSDGEEISDGFSAMNQRLFGDRTIFARINTDPDGGPIMLASDMDVINPDITRARNQSEWDVVIEQIEEIDGWTGPSVRSINVRVESWEDAVRLVENAFGIKLGVNDVESLFSRFGGYEPVTMENGVTIMFHPNEGPIFWSRTQSPGNNLPHIKWTRPGKGDLTAGHIFFGNETDFFAPELD